MPTLPYIHFQGQCALAIALAQVPGASHTQINASGALRRRQGQFQRGKVIINYEQFHR